MKAIPVAVRQRIVALHEQGRSTEGIARYAGYCVAAVRRVRQQFRARGTLEPQTQRCGRKTLLTEPRRARLQKLGGGPTRRDLGRTGRPAGPPVWNLHGGHLAAP